MQITFTHPEYLWILLALPLFIILHFFTLSYAKTTAIKFANFDAIQRVAKGQFLGTPYKGFMRNKNPGVLLIRTLVYTLLIFSISGATLWYMGLSSEYDFVLALDTSASMLADDFDPNRLVAAKESALLFIDTVPKKTKIGLLSFSGIPYVEMPVSEDHAALKQKIADLDIKKAGGTNIGDAILSSVSMLKQGQDDISTNAIILLTDGNGNIGTSVEEAVKNAKENNILAYTIGIGTKEGASFVDTELVSTIDDVTLAMIANETSATYYKVEDAQNMKDAFTKIASLSKKRVSTDLSWIFLLVALILLSLEWLLVNTKYRTVP
jgi:Ca-activated chloride channel family protein